MALIIYEPDGLASRPDASWVLPGTYFVYFTGGVAVLQVSDGTTWVDLAGGAPSGTAGGALAGTYPSPGLNYSHVSSTHADASSSTDYVASSDMTFTPEAGTYLVYFNAEVEPDAGTVVTIAVFAAGLMVDGSERHHYNERNGNSNSTSIAVVAVSGSEAIEGQFKVDVGSATLGNRSLTILRVA